MKVCLGGTFSIIHKGHHLLFNRAFAGESRVYIGLTSDELVRKHKSMPIDSFDVRNKQLHRLMIRKGWQDRYSIVKLEDPLGPAVHMDFDAIVVSRETRPNAEAINTERTKRGLKPLEIFTVEMALAENGEVISSSKIYRGDMDSQGNLQRQVIVSVGSANPIKLNAVKNVFLERYRDVRVVGAEVQSGVPEQPLERQVIQGALERARSAMTGDADFAVGIEAGLFRDDGLDLAFDVQFCAIVDRAGRITVGHGPGFHYPHDVMELVRQGKPVGRAMEELCGIEDIRSTEGAVGYLSGGVMTRTKLTEQAVMMAMIPRIRPDLYGI